MAGTHQSLRRIASSSAYRLESPSKPPPIGQVHGVPLAVQGLEPAQLQDGRSHLSCRLVFVRICGCFVTKCDPVPCKVNHGLHGLASLPKHLRALQDFLQDPEAQRHGSGIDPQLGRWSGWSGFSCCHAVRLRMPASDSLQLQKTRKFVAVHVAEQNCLQLWPQSS